MINWSATKEEYDLIVKIADRGISILAEIGGFERDKMEYLMSITACHCNGCPLDLQRFLEGDDSNFLHDFIGINNNTSRETGKLENCFLPRFIFRGDV